MSCPGCGHDWCPGNCPPCAPLEYEYCVMCGEREELDDLSEDYFCFDCILKGYSRETTECHGCGSCITEKEFSRGEKPYVVKEVRGLTMTLCPLCEERMAKEVA